MNEAAAANCRDEHARARAESAARGRRAARPRPLPGPAVATARSALPSAPGSTGPAATMAKTTGLIPQSNQEVSGSFPNRTYAHPSAPVISMAGTMKVTPAVMRPDHRRRSQPMWIAISVELGPGMRLTAPRRSKKRSSVSHRRRRTTSSRIIAMCAAGPPNAVAPNLKKRSASSASEVLVGGMSPGNAFLLAVTSVLRS